MTSPSVDLAEIELAVEQLELGADVFELHGGICGLLCTRGPGAVDRWLRESGVVIRADMENREQLLETLHAAEADAWRALHAASFDFEVVLPAEEVELAERVAALAAWSHGFVTGIGLGGVSAVGAQDPERPQVEEILADLSEISRMTLTDDDASDTERAGFDLAAVAEHVRVCVQLAFELLQNADQSSREPVGTATTH
jgi:uncharacterized protein YgfB (UPF0149 family)